MPWAKARSLIGNHSAFAVDGRGGVSEFVLDQSGQIKSVSDQFGVYQQVERNELNQVVATVDGNGNRIEYEYDDRGNIIREVDPLGGTTLRTFDNEDQRIRPAREEVLILDGRINFGLFEQLSPNVHQ